MQIYNLSLNEILCCNVPIVACIGYFDGVHLGHQELIKEANILSKNLGCESGLITFNPDPWVTIKGVHDIKHITTMKQRMKLAEQFGIQHFFVLDFSIEMARLAHEQFLDFLIKNIHLKGIVCGFDFHYGYKGIGNDQTLKEYAKNRFEFKLVDSINDSLGKISSSRICDLILEGKVLEASKLLGYSFSLLANVIHGKAQGKEKLGFPTANCSVSSEIILPKRGVYVGKVVYNNDEYKAMINIGHNPTFNERRMISIEAHILDFDEDLYEKQIEVIFVDYIRDEKRFNSIEELIKQLNSDVSTTRNYYVAE